MSTIRVTTQKMTTELANALKTDQKEIAKGIVHKLQFMKRLQQECEHIEEELIDDI